MKKAQKILSVVLALLFVFVGLNLNVFAAAKVVKPKVVISVQPKTQYFVGDRISLSVKAPNYKGKVQYRIHVRNSKGQIVNELFAKYPGKYYNKQISAQGNFNVGFSVKAPGTYYVVVYVKRPGAKVYYDSYVVSKRFVVREKVVIEEPKEEEPKDVVLDKEGQEYTKDTIEKDVYLKANNTRLYNAKVLGTVYVNPGENGNATLENVEAEMIVVLSGAKNSIHFKSVKAKNLEVKAEKGVRVVAEGTTAIEQTNVLSEAIVEVKAGSVGKVIVEKEAAGKTIELKGNFATVEVLTEVKVVVTEGKIEKIDVKAKAEVVVNKDAVVVDVVKNNNEVKISGDGKIEKIDGKEQTSGGSTGGGYIPPSPTNGLLNIAIGSAIDAVWNFDYVSDRFNKPTLNSLGYINGAYNYSIDLTAKNPAIKEYTVAQSYDILRQKFLSYGKLDEQNPSDAKTTKVLNTANTLKGILGNISVKVGANDEFKGFDVYLSDVFASKNMTNAKNYIDNPTAANYNALYDKIQSDNDFQSLSAIIPYIYLLTAGDVTYNAIKVYGINVESIAVNDVTVYGTNDKTITVVEVKNALGVSAIQIAKIDDFVNKPIKVILNDGNYRYVYTMTLK